MRGRFGFGDITPKNNAERLIAVVLMFGGSMVSAVLLAYLSSWTQAKPKSALPVDGLRHASVMAAFLQENLFWAFAGK